MIEFTTEELLLIMEALSMAASRHESQGHVTRGAFRAEHDDKAAKMRRLRQRLTRKTVPQKF